MKAISIKGNSVEEISTALKQSQTNGFHPTLAIVFLSIKQDREAICKILEEQGLQILGATTAGEFIDGDIGDGSTAIMLLDIDPSLFRVLFEETTDKNTFETAQHLGRQGKEIFNNPAFIVVSGGISTDGEMIVRGIEKAVGHDVTIFGGLAGDDFTMTGTYVFTNGKVTNNGLAVLVLDEDRVSVKGLATSGWKPVGTVRTITKSEGNVVYTIDDQPALDVVIKFMGVSKDLDEWKDVIVNIGSEFPMQLLREGQPPVIRAPLYANKNDRSFLCAGSVPQGSKIRFSLPPDFDVIDKVVSECDEVKNAEQPEADAMIMFSCKARHLSLGPLVSDEINRVKEVWNAPMVGFFCYGEMGKASKGQHEFHNNTCSLVVLKELN